MINGKGSVVRRRGSRILTGGSDLEKRQTAFKGSSVGESFQENKAHQDLTLISVELDLKPNGYVQKNKLELDQRKELVKKRSGQDML